MQRDSLINSFLDLLEDVALLEGGLPFPVEGEAAPLAPPGVAAHHHVDDVRQALLLLRRVGQGRRSVYNAGCRHLITQQVRT
jgi:hypothetical protein